MANGNFTNSADGYSLPFSAIISENINKRHQGRRKSVISEKGHITVINILKIRIE